MSDFDDTDNEQVVVNLIEHSTGIATESMFLVAREEVGSDTGLPVLMCLVKGQRNVPCKQCEVVVH